MIGRQLCEDLYIHDVWDVFCQSYIQDVRPDAGAKERRCIRRVCRNRDGGKIVKESPPRPIDNSATPRTMLGVEIPGRQNRNIIGEKPIDNSATPRTMLGVEIPGRQNRNIIGEKKVRNWRSETPKPGLAQEHYINILL
ncbi:hypothetical protein QE152_g23561 [Popillia japonica]|uniref:Uncharacterized protein n=1 Tax=Popillia japonica TaxID=7064 RepID=A0AAW1KFD3_POPJA